MTKDDALTLLPGTLVYCRVYGARGWYSVTAIRPRDGYLKVAGLNRPSSNAWCPHYNFSLTSPHDLT